MSTYRILGKPVSAEAWRELVALLELQGGKSAVDARLADGALSRDDLVAIYDANADGRLCADDVWLSGMPLSLTAILQKHGIALRPLLEDRPGKGKFTRDYYLRMVQWDSDFLSLVPDALRHDPEFLLDCFRDSMALASGAVFVPDTLQTPAFINALIAWNPAVVAHLSRTKDDPARWLQAVRQDDGIVRNMPEAIWRASPDIRRYMLTAVQARPSLVSTFGDRPARPITIALWRTALRADPDMHSQVPSSLRDEPVIRAKIVRQVWRGLQPIDNTARHALGLRPLSVEEQKKFSEQFGNGLSPAQREEVWNFMVQDLRADGVTFPFPIDTFPQFIRGLSDAGIDFPERAASIDSLATLLGDRTAAAGDSRPVLLMLAPKADHNGAFASVFNRVDERGPSDYNSTRLDTLVQHSPFRVVYYESGSEQDDLKFLRQVTQDFTQPVHTLWWAGHGSATTLQRGNGRGEHAQLDTGDLLGRPDGMRTAIRRAVTHQIVLDACSNGAGGVKDADNLTNAVAASAAPGVRVLSSQTPSNIATLQVDAHGGIALTYALAPDETAVPRDSAYVAVADGAASASSQWMFDASWQLGGGMVRSAPGLRYRLALGAAHLWPVTPDGLWVGPQVTGGLTLAGNTNVEDRNVSQVNALAGVGLAYLRSDLSVEGTVGIGVQRSLALPQPFVGYLDSQLMVSVPLTQGMEVGASVSLGYNLRANQLDVLGSALMIWRSF